MADRKGLNMVDTGDWVEVVFCPDCAIVIANGDTSGISGDRLAGHLKAMDENLSGWWAHVDGDLDRGYCHETCSGCGSHGFSDQWFSGWLEPARA